MPETERRDRMADLRKKVRAHDIRAWADEQQRVFDLTAETAGIVPEEPTAADKRSIGIAV